MIVQGLVDQAYREVVIGGLAGHPLVALAQRRDALLGPVAGIVA